MTTINARHVICVLGRWRNFKEVEAILLQTGCTDFELDREYSQLSSDERMMRSFEASYDRMSPSMTEADWIAVQEHSAVVYVLSPPIRIAHDLEVSSRALKLVAALLSGGGLAAKSDSAGIAHGRTRWLEMAERHASALQNNDLFNQGASLFRSWVKMPLVDQDDDMLYSCGMHLLGERDMEIDSELALEDAIEWMELFGLYVVADRPTRQLKDGEGFRLTDNGPRRLMSLQPCRRYEEDHYFFNPHGYIRLVEDE